MKAVLWGGPHDGLELEVDRTSCLLRMPVSSHPAVASRPAELMDMTAVAALVARYIRIENTNNYTYAGQEAL